jgi:starvation-inducible DNA-binding protein
MIVEAANTKDARVLLEDLCGDWGGVKHCELAVLLSATRALAQLHQTHHWQAGGETYYGDHLLFDRLYSDVNEEIDQIAERLVGVASPDLVDVGTVAAQVERVLREAFRTDGKDPVAASLAAEELYLDLLGSVSTSLDEQDLLSYGTDDLLAGIADKHEEHVYLLKRRSS